MVKKRYQKVILKNKKMQQASSEEKGFGSVKQFQH